MMTDVAIAMTHLRAIGGYDGDGFALVHDGAPVPKARARWSPRSRRWYTPQTTREAEAALAWALRRALGRRKQYADTLALVALFFVPTRRRADVDNMLKTVMDAGNQAGIWVDDSLVVAQTAIVEIDRDHPRTVIALGPYLGTLTRAPLFTPAPERVETDRRGKGGNYHDAGQVTRVGASHAR